MHAELPANTQGTGKTNQESRAPRRAARDKGKAGKRDLMPFPYYGGKFSHRSFILKHTSIPVDHYCEPFGGSGAVLFNRPREFAKVETHNDTNRIIHNTFTVMQCPEKGARLMYRLGMSRFFSHLEYVRCLQVLKGDKDSHSDVDRAFAFLYAAGQTRTGLVTTASQGRWPFHRFTSRNGMSGGASKWLTQCERYLDLYDMIQTRGVQFLCDDAFKVMARVAGEDRSGRILFYVDPPYHPATRADRKSYANELDGEGHARLVSYLDSMPENILVAVSGYRCTELDAAFVGWRREDDRMRPIRSSAKGGERVESLWLNFDASGTRIKR
jgi:DNA adenine methylase